MKLFRFLNFSHVCPHAVFICILAHICVCTCRCASQAALAGCQDAPESLVCIYFSCAYLCCVSIRIYFGLSVSICCVSIRIYFGFCVSSFPFPIIWKVGLKKRRTVCIAPTHATRSSARIPHNIFWGCHGPYDPYESHSAVHIGAATGFNMKYVLVNHGKLL